MDQVKFGCFIKNLRKEKGLTQEQLAEQFGVSGRTVSRWETGSNMPDITILIELADFYEVDIREIINGERRQNENMDKDVKETALKVAEYNDTVNQIVTKRMRALSILGVVALAVFITLEASGLSAKTVVYENISDVALGFACGIMITNVLYTTGLLIKIKSRRFNRKSKTAQ